MFILGGIEFPILLMWGPAKKLPSLHGMWVEVSCFPQELSLKRLLFVVLEFLISFTREECDRVPTQNVESKPPHHLEPVV